VLAKETSDKIGANLGHTPQTPWICLAHEIGISKSMTPHLIYEVNSNLFKQYTERERETE
jgi:hypothetical protein